MKTCSLNLLTNVKRLKSALLLFAVFLSDASKFVTAINVPVDGGFSA
ncbi:MAG: hypothetical protein HKP41_00525 [Desulfobacterales bacterium]|nr:hypothetical protein [Desulfobacterales bacterium]